MVSQLTQLKARLAKRKDKGFTLMELLIVIAIISVLVAIAIPAFTAQLNSAKDAADKANARALYALAQADWMSDPNHTERHAGAVLNEDHKVVVTLEDDSTQSFTFSDRVDSVQVFYETNGAHVRVTGQANSGAGFEYPEG